MKAKLKQELYFPADRGNFPITWFSLNSVNEEHNRKLVYTAALNEFKTYYSSYFASDLSIQIVFNHPSFWTRFGSQP